ncbi:putative malate dehydrogenase, partial [Crucibulum laeve]
MVKRSGCDISNAKITGFPTSFAAPSLKPSFAAVAIGVQNYTCGSTGTYTNVGAVAELFDISCLYGSSAFDTIQDAAIDIWKIAPPIFPAQEVIAILHSTNTPAVLGQHYYVTNPLTGQGVNPKWDFTSQGANAGNSNAFVVAAKVTGVSAPTGSQDIDWVDLKALTGSLAQEVYRTDTREGQPPASCTPGSPMISVKYAAKY